MRTRDALLFPSGANLRAGGSVLLRPGGRGFWKARGGAHPRYFLCLPKESNQRKGPPRLALRYAPGSLRSSVASGRSQTRLPAAGSNKLAFPASALRCSAASRGMCPPPAVCIGGCLKEGSGVRTRDALLFPSGADLRAGGSVLLRPGGRGFWKARGGVHPRYFLCLPKESNQRKGPPRLALRYAPGSLRSLVESGRSQTRLPAAGSNKLAFPASALRCSAASRGIYPSPAVTRLSSWVACSGPVAEDRKP